MLGNYSNPDQRRIGVISRLRAATPVETPAGNPTRQTVRQDDSADQIVSPAKIRDWARANGYQVGDRGRIPAPIKKAWAVANEP
ncbi:histone-like nucleoid-structuring protein Lsr2 [Raineyella sp. W15-4]|uniref:Lsr2 family DNA-binding protein n=1 Tax=Raineyella sp. W15-4 TaxID=3081651 RepID=UPI0029556EA1|nr:histone-like nucleoid-structuring protein Lsr2 [Raineyella sp. W15-4]WOQ15581.1 histone-like nucleoid-structuring protein Lsr2 [Raineyella sp. W15-4]